MTLTFGNGYKEAPALDMLDGRFFVLSVTVC